MQDFDRRNRGTPRQESREVDAIYPALLELQRKGFPQADPLCAVILELGLALTYLGEGDEASDRSKLSMVPARLSQAADLLALPEFGQTGKVLADVYEKLSSGREKRGEERLDLLGSAREILTQAVRQTLSAASKLESHGFGPSRLSHIEDMRGQSVRDGAEKLRNLREHVAALYLASALEAVFEALLRAEAKDMAQSANFLRSAGMDLSDAERTRPTLVRYLGEGSRLDVLRRIQSGLQTARDDLFQGQVWDARRGLMAVVQAANSLY